MKLMKITILILALSGIFFNCHKKEKTDNTSTLLLLLVADQASGNCATITKTTTGTSYAATGSTVPKGGCNAGTLQSGTYTTSPATAKTAVDTYYDGLKAVYDVDATNCATMSTAQTAAKALATEASITAIQTAQTSGNAGCTALGGGDLFGGKITAGKISSLFICKDEASITAVKARSNFHATSSVATDMAASLTDLQAQAVLTKATTGYTDAAIVAMTATGPTELAVFTQPKAIAALNASFASAACAKSVLATDATLKPIFASITGISGFFTPLGITTDDAKAVTITKTIGLKCGYGSAFTAVTTAGLVNPTCPTAYPTF